jgi:ClpP class serine protease
MIQGEVDEIYGWFQDAVTSNRNVAEGSMEGQSMLGTAAVQAGLADGIQSFEDAVQWAETAADQRQ